MNHKEFVKYLNKHGFVPCGSNGCLAHIPCDWLTLENFMAAAERHQAWLNEQGVDIAKILKPASQSEGWCVLWANDGTNAGSGTYLLPKYWLGNSDILDPDAPRTLHGYRLAFEFFWIVLGNLKLSCRITYPSPYERLDLLRRYLGLVGTQKAPTAENFSASPVIIASAAQGFPQFDVDDYSRMTGWLLTVLRNPEQNFKDFVLLTLGLIEKPQRYITGDIKDLIKISSVYDIYNIEIESLTKKWFQSKQEILAPGTILPDWPKVVLSDEDPPIFKTNSYIKKMYEEDRDEGPALDFPPDVEEWLGCYIPEKKTIILWTKGIELCTKRLFAGRDENGRSLMGVPEEDLFNCVYVHELGHWFSHVAHTPNGILWNSSKIYQMPPEGDDEKFGYSPKTISKVRGHGFPSHINGVRLMHFLTKVDLGVDGSLGDAYSLSSSSYHEVWAQWFAWLYGHEKDPGVLHTFEILERLQSRPYKAWRKLVSTAPNPNHGPYTLSHLRFTQERILESLEWSRSHGIPVTFDDKKHPATNMLGWLCARTNHD